MVGNLTKEALNLLSQPNSVQSRRKRPRVVNANPRTPWPFMRHPKLLFFVALLQRRNAFGSIVADPDSNQKASLAPVVSPATKHKQDDRLVTPNAEQPPKLAPHSYIATKHYPSYPATRPSSKKNASAAFKMDTNRLQTKSNEASTTDKETKRRKGATNLDDMDFMKWCNQVLGIYSILEIHTFEYYDYMKALPDGDWDEELDDDRLFVDNLPILPVRGLAASRDITEGETVIRIPIKALLSVATTIDQDPVLGRVMGPEVRHANGWTTEGEEEASFLIEMPLLAVALLHHRKLGPTSPLAAYIQILESSPIDSMPFLWSAERLKQDASEGIRTVARGIRREMQNMYTTFLEVLIQQSPDIFGPETEGEEHFFSIENFQWAFAMVNSRHWELPIEELESHDASNFATPPKTAPIEHEEEDHQGIPPASIPTDIWTKEIGEINVEGDAGAVVSHSFLAPVADLLNFGPPCTRGIYVKETHTFEIVATCSFGKGQEVTFWYSDECDDVMVGVYGFTHPIVPRCPSAEEYRRLGEDWKNRANDLESLLKVAYENSDACNTELRIVEDILDDCDCCKDDARERRIPRLRHENSENHGSPQQEDIARHGIRKGNRDSQPKSRNSEF